jgi:hypothetical protein
MNNERWFGLGIVRSPGSGGEAGGTSGVGAGGGATGGNGAGSGGSAAPVAPTAPSAAGGAAPGLDGAPSPIAPPPSWNLEGFDDEDGGSGEVGEPGQEPPAQVEPPAPEPAAPEPQPQPQPQPEVAAAPAAPPASQRRPGVQGYLDEMVQNKDQIVQAVAEMRFKMSDEDVKAIEEDFVKALPMLAGRVWFEAYTSAVNFMNQQIPSIMRGEMQKFGRSFEAENQFYKAWPGLDRGKHHEQVKHFGRVYRQAYPQASVEDFVRDVGTMVASQLGLANANRPPAGGGQGPAANGAGANGTRRVVDAFVPAGTGGGQQGRPAAGRSPAANANPFEGLGIEFEE